MTAKLLKGTLSAKEINSKLKLLNSQLESNFKFPRSRLPRVALIDACLNLESKLYVRKKKSVISEIGFSYKEYILESYNRNEVANLINNLNSDQYINGILLQLPIPVREDTNKLINMIDPRKDIDGLTDANLDNIKNNDESAIKSCAALGIIHLLKKVPVNFKSDRFVLVGNGKLINYPLGLLLKHSYGVQKIDIVDIDTQDSENIIKMADVIVSATSVKHRIRAEFVKNGAIVVDTGSINKKEVEFEKLLDVASFITPVPGGLGPLTISYLMANILKAFCLQNSIPFSEEEICFLKSKR